MSNPLTQIAAQRKASLAEAAAGVPDAASWHARFAHSAYVFAGGLPEGLTEGDVLAVFAQYGEVVDVHLAR
jgi:RNA-binding motif X-linked protein 2